MKRILKWIGVAALGVVGLFLLATALGALLPEAHVATTRAIYPTSPPEVWEAIADPPASATWRSDVDRVEVLSTANGRPDRWREHGQYGVTTYETVVSEPPRSRTVRIADPELPYGGRWVYEIEPDGVGTALTITEEGEVYNPLFRFMARFVFGHHATMERIHGDLGRRFGVEEIAIQRVR